MCQPQPSLTNLELATDKTMDAGVGTRACTCVLFLLPWCMHAVLCILRNALDLSSRVRVIVQKYIYMFMYVRVCNDNDIDML